jgi:DNA polymerase-1
MEMFAVDFSQFEMRLGAHYSKDANLIRIFREGLDPHSDTAVRVFKKTLAEVESDEGKLLYRAPCKNINFSIFYLITPEGLYDLMLVSYATAGVPMPDWLTVEWCAQLIDDWFGIYPGVLEYIESQKYRSFRYELVWTLLGRIRRIPEIRSVHSRIVSAGLRQAGNAPIQGTQSDLFKLALAETYAEVIKSARKHGVHSSVLMAVHDEIVGEAEEGYGALIVDQMEQIMSQVMIDRDTGLSMCEVPISAEGHTMSRWKK